MLVDHSTLNLAYNTFDKNRCTAAGSAVQVLGRKVANVNPAITNNTFYRNTAVSEGAAIYCQEVSPEIRRNIFVTDSTNLAVLEIKSSPLYECNLIHSRSGRPLGRLPGASAIEGDPHFCDPENANFHVRDLSPAAISPCGLIGSQDKGCTTFKMLPSR